MSATRTTTGIIVRINGVEHGIDEIDVSWLHQQIDRRRRAGEAVCVIVSAHTDRVNMTLATPDCSPGGGGGRPPNGLENEIFAHWREMVIGKGDFTAGNLCAFLQYLERVA